jgi:transposase
MLFLEYDIRWVHCRDCGRVVEQVPWAAEASARFTEDFDQAVVSLTQRCDKTAVQEQMRIAWRTVGSCVERVLRRFGPADPLADLTTIGVDELSYRKGHYYVTVVTDLLKRAVVWGKEGKKAETLKAFFEELGPERRAEIQRVCMDMSGAYQKAVQESLPHAEIVFDRFHVQALASLALDETRRAEWQRVRGDKELAASVKGLRWALLKDPVTLSGAERARLADLQRENRRIYRGYLLKEQLGDILDRRQPNVARALLLKWCTWAKRSKLPDFAKLAKTIKDHLEGIVAYVRWRITNGPTEGLNTKARLITRRAYGFHSAEAVLAMIRLCCSGIRIRPVHKGLAA